MDCQHENQQFDLEGFVICLDCGVRLVAPVAGPECIDDDDDEDSDREIDRQLDDSADVFD